MTRRMLAAVSPLLLIILLPIALRRSEVSDDATAGQLVIISPHNEAIRHEFESAFRRYSVENYGEDVDIDWRTPGGTSDIVRYIKSEYTASFRHFWLSDGKAWTPEVRSAVLDRKLKQDGASEAAWTARQTFLGSDLGIGIDLFFGGGQYDYGKMAKQGMLVPCGVRDRQPELFAGSPATIEQGLSGETWYDKADRYYGVCLSAFGICYNPDRLLELGFDRSGTDFPRQWQDLGFAPTSTGIFGPAHQHASIASRLRVAARQPPTQQVAVGRLHHHRPASQPEVLPIPT